MRMLPGCFSPQPEEMFSSWFARLAYNHLLSPQQLYDYLIPKRKFPYSAIYRSDQSINDLLTLLASRTLTSAERIQQTLLTNYQLYQQSLIYYKKEIWLLNATPRLDHSNKSGLMYCPGCLANDSNRPYFRQRWSLSFLTTCLDCGLLLLDQCPQCGSPPAFLHIPLSKSQDPPSLSTCWRCGFNLATAFTVKATYKYLVDQQQLLHQLSLIKIVGEFNTPTYFFVLYHALRTIYSLARKREIALPLKFIRYQQRYSYPWNFTKLSIQARAELLQWAQLLLANCHYEDHLSNYYKQKSRQPKKYPIYLMNVYFNELLVDRSVEELMPLFGLRGYKDFSQLVG